MASDENTDVRCRWRVMRCSVLTSSLATRNSPLAIFRGCEDERSATDRPDADLGERRHDAPAAALAAALCPLRRPGRHASDSAACAPPDARQFPTPAVAGFRLGYGYRVLLVHLPDMPADATLCPSLEIISTLHIPPGLRAEDFPATVQFTIDDIRLAAAGGLVTKVIYLEDPLQAPAVNSTPVHAGGVRRVPRPRSARGSAVRGRPMAIVRLGGRDVPLPELAAVAIQNTVLAIGDKAFGPPAGPPTLPPPALAMVRPDPRAQKAARRNPARRRRHRPAHRHEPRRHDRQCEHDRHRRRVPLRPRAEADLDLEPRLPLLAALRRAPSGNATDFDRRDHRPPEPRPPLANCNWSTASSMTRS